jgi:hypothetical protein
VLLLGVRRIVLLLGVRRAVLPLIALATVALLAGCGGQVTLPDLFIVYRMGTVPGAHLTLLVNEGGQVHCDGGTALQLSDPQLVKARGIQEELHEAASNHLDLPAQSGSVFSYYLRDEEGYLRFSDNSHGQSKAMRELQELVLEVGQKVCHKGV